MRKNAAPQQCVAIVGPGAIGGLLAASLHESGQPVLLVTRNKKQTKHIRTAGIHITGLKGRSRTYRRWLDISDAPRKRSNCAAVFICVKSNEAAKALRSIENIVGPETAIIPLLNGVTHIIPWERRYGGARTVFGACYIAAMRTKPSAIRHTGGEGVVLAQTPYNRHAFKTARRLLRQAGWRVRFTNSPQRLLWTKMIYNAAVNPIGALTRKTNGQLASEPALRELVCSVVREASDIARAAGFPALDTQPEKRVLQGCRAAPHQINSMSQDIEAGRKTEADAILKPLLLSARRTKKSTHYIEPLYRMIRGLEKLTL